MTRHLASNKNQLGTSFRHPFSFLYEIRVAEKSCKIKMTVINIFNQEICIEGIAKTIKNKSV